MMMRPVSYLQTDPRWSERDYSAVGERTTIRASGCGPTAMAMVLATWADPAVTPETEAAWALAHGWKCPHSGTYYGYFVPAAARYGLACRRLNAVNIYGKPNDPAHDLAARALRDGELVIACMGKGNWTSSGHYVLCWRLDGDTIYINDPASTRKSRTEGDYALFRRQVKYYWAIKLAEKGNREDEDDMTKEEVRKIVQEVLEEERTPAPATYDTLEEVPGWGRAAVGWLVGKGALRGDGGALGLTYDALRLIVIMWRLKDEMN